MPLPPPRPREPIGCAEDSSRSVLRGSPVCAAAPSSSQDTEPEEAVEEAAEKELDELRAMRRLQEGQYRL